MLINEELSKAQSDLRSKSDEISRFQEEINRLNNIIEELKTPAKKVINSKKDKSAKADVNIPDPPNETDDF